MLEREMTPHVLNTTSASRPIPPMPPVLIRSEPVLNHPASTERLEEQVRRYSFSPSPDDDGGLSSGSDNRDGDSGLGREIEEGEERDDVGNGGDEGLWTME